MSADDGDEESDAEWLRELTRRPSAAAASSSASAPVDDEWLDELLLRPSAVVSVAPVADPVATGSPVAQAVVQSATAAAARSSNLYSYQSSLLLNLLSQLPSTPAAEPEPAPEPGETPGALCNNPHCYVGVTRYAARRWLGGDHLRPEDGHRANWRKMHILAAYSLRIGDHEEYLIQALRRCYGELRCANARGGGGGTSPYKPSMLYLCTGRRGRR